MVIKKIASVIFCILLVATVSSCHHDRFLWYQKIMDVHELSEYEAKEEKIAFIDTGIQKDLIEEYNVVDTYNVIDNTRNVDDGNGHGTAVVSVAAGTGYKGITGIIPEAQLVIIKAADENGKMTLENLDKALEYAQKQDVDVVNISLGGYKSERSIIDRMKAMYDENIVIVASAGDYGQKDLLFPANCNQCVLSVAAFDQNGDLWEDNNIDSGLACAFPGTDICVLNNRLEIETVEGTSEASALASSYIIKLKAAYKKQCSQEMSSEEVFSVIKSLGTLKSGKIDYIKPLKSLSYHSGE